MGARAGPVLDDDFIVSAGQGSDQIAARERPGHIPGVDERLEAQSVRSATVGNDRVLSRPKAEHIDIRTGAAGERVVSPAAIQRVIAAKAIQVIIGGVAYEIVGELSARSIQVASARKSQVLQLRLIEIICGGQ